MIFRGFTGDPTRAQGSLNFPQLTRCKPRRRVSEPRSAATRCSRSRAQGSPSLLKQRRSLQTPFSRERDAPRRPLDWAQDEPIRDIQTSIFDRLGVDVEGFWEVLRSIFRGSTGGRTHSQGSVNLAKPVFARARPRRGPGQELGSKRTQEAQLHLVDGSYSLARPKTDPAEGSRNKIGSCTE